MAGKVLTLIAILSQCLVITADVRVNKCSSGPCFNGGLCSQIQNGYICTCVNGFIGIHCEMRSDDCPVEESIKCVNGHCSLGANGTPKCECNANYGGRYCNQKLNTCTHVSCNGGTCSDTPEGYLCLCPIGHTGKNCQIADKNTQQCLGSCNDGAAKPGGGKCWHNGSETIKVGWGYQQPLCSTRESCFAMGNKSYDFIDVQLKPVQAQPNDTIVFLTDVDASLYDDKFVPHVIPVEASSSEAFTKCNTSNAIPFANFSWGGIGELKVNTSFLHMGTQYFIANVNSLHRCEFGLRLNVTIKDNKCIDPSDKDSSLCHGHGKCYTDFTKKSFECSCCGGYSGKYCKDEDPCYATPCKNNGQCYNVKGMDGKKTFRCQCPAGFVGFDCSRTKDFCDNAPCQNGGNCISTKDGFVCHCQKGFSGDKCQVNDDKCACSPCLNGGTCQNVENGFNCTCMKGFRGTLCEVNIDDCSQNPCHNGICIDGVDQYQCNCNAGYKGKTCDIIPDKCDHISCGDGKCIKNQGSGECSCGIGYTGSNCDIKINLCQSTVFCIEENRLGCTDHGNSVTCTCSDGFTGSNCGVNIDDCAVHPCQNGGKCIDKINGFECVCVGGASGRLCEVASTSTGKPLTTERGITHPTTTEKKDTTTKKFSLEITIDLQIVTDSCHKFKTTSALESFTKSVSRIIKDACKCMPSNWELLPSLSTVLCSDDVSGKFVSKVGVANKDGEKKIICALNTKIKTGQVPTTDRNTYIVGINTNTGLCDKTKNDWDKGPVPAGPSAYDKNRKTGIIIGCVVTGLVILISGILLFVKYRNRAIQEVKPTDNDQVKTFLNFVHESDLELIAPKSAWSTPEQTPELNHDPYRLKYAIKKPKKFDETAFSFENPGGNTSTV